MLFSSPTEITNPTNAISDYCIPVNFIYCNWEKKKLRITVYVHAKSEIPLKKATFLSYVIKHNLQIIHLIIIFLHGLGRLTCSGIDALPSFPGASTVSSSSRFIVEGVFRESGVVHSFKVVDPALFVFESHVLYSRDL